MRRTLLVLTLACTAGACSGSSSDAPARSDAAGAEPDSTGARAAAPPTAPAGTTAGETPPAPPPDAGTVPGTFIGAEESWDGVRDGLHLVLTYDEGIPGFTGMLTNDNGVRVCAASAEVEVENGPLLGPSAAVDLEPGAAHPVEIPTAGEPVTWWSAESSYQACG